MSEFEWQPFYRPITRIEKFRLGLIQLGIKEPVADEIVRKVIREHELSRVYGTTLHARIKK